MSNLTIGRLAREAGVGVETVRYYERRGLIPDPPRRRSGYREFPLETVGRLRFIRRAKQLGFSLREIEELLALSTEPRGGCREVREQIAAKLEDVASRIRDLRRMSSALEELHMLCDSSDPLGDCPILDLLQTEPDGAD